MLSAKRKAEGPPIEENLQSVSTKHIRPGGVGVVTALGAQEASVLNLRLNNAAAQVTAAKDEEGAPLAISVTGFQQSSLNARYTARLDLVFHGRRTYWTEAPQAGTTTRHFIAWQKALGRWAICASAEGAGSSNALPEAQELERCPCQAFQLDQGNAPGTWVRLVEPGRWMERRDAGWGKVDTVQIIPATPPPLAAPRPSTADLRPLAVDFAGFRRLDMNARYIQRVELQLHGKPSYWDASGRFFVYWQGNLRRWAICGKQALDAARQGQCPGCACQLDLVHFATPSRWVEYVDGTWVSVPVEVTVHEAPQEAGELAQGSSDPGAAAASAASIYNGASGPQTLAAAFVQAAMDKVKPDAARLITVPVKGSA